MDQERQQVLEMLANGRITTEEAGRLLDALAPPVAPPSPDSLFRTPVPPVPPVPPMPPVPPIPRAAFRARAPRGRPGRRSGGPDLESLMGLSALGVSPGFVRELREHGFKRLTPEEVMAIATTGMSAADFGSLRERAVEAGAADPSVEDLVGLAMLGTSPEQLEEWASLFAEGDDEDEGDEEPQEPEPEAPTAEAPRPG